MKFGLLMVVALLAGAFAAHFLIEDRGYVLVRFLGYTLETSIPVLLLALLGLYLAVRLLAWAWHAPRRLGAAASQFRDRRTGHRFTRGLIDYAEGNWARGERILGKTAGSSDTPLLHYLTAARAAQLQGAFSRRDNWLKLAYETTPEAATAVLLTQAELQLAQRQYEEALASLRRIEERHRNHPQALVLLARLHERRGEWRELAALLPRLGAHAGLPPERRDALISRALIGVLTLPDLDEATLERSWKDLPRRLRRLPELQRARASALQRLGQNERCAQEIHRQLSRHTWDGELVLLYGRLETRDVAGQLRQAEKWLESRPEDAELLLTAGRLAIRAELWGKARSYLETSLEIQPRADTFQVYGRLMAQLGHADAAAEAFRSGLTLVAGSGAVLPALAAPASEPS